MSPQTTPQLSKTRFIDGLQCLKRLYLECYHRDLIDPIDPRQQALFDSGTAVGELARQRFPDGRLVDEGYSEHAQAVRTTRKALDDRSVPTLYEAAFALEGIRIRADILSRNGSNAFDLIEVKSSTKVKPAHIPDVAIQLHVLEGSGVNVTRTYLLHVDNTYVYPGGPYDLDQLFHLEDITGEARAFLSAAVPGALASMWEVLQADEVPAVANGPHCTSPYPCPFHGHCHQGGLEHPVQDLPRASGKVLEELKKSGISDIREIPSGFPGLTPSQERVRHCVAAAQPYLSSELASELRQVKFPVHFLDFETFNPGLPLYVGTRPYQIVPFQWSLHIREGSEPLRHESFLHDDAGDPREAFVTSLLDSVLPEGSIVVYSGYEQTIIKQLAEIFPEHEGRLLALCDRLFDLLKLLRKNYYHPEFHGSYSIKSVLPALVPEMSYGDLEIQDGSVASVAFARMIAADTPEPERVKIQGGLLAYCQRDTEAMVRVFDTLHSVSG